MSEKKATESSHNRTSMDWMNMLNQFWGPLTQNWMAAMTTPTGAQSTKSKGRVGETMQSTIKMWQAMFKTISSPESSVHFKTASQMTPDILLSFSQTCMRAFMDFQNQMGDWLQKTGQSAKPSDFEDLDKELIHRWTDTYEKEFSQFLKIPQIGLGRFYQEKMLQAVDKSNLFQAAVSEFLHVLYLPIEKSFQILQHKVAEQVDAGELDENPKVTYNMWIQILEGCYMELFKQQEFAETLQKTIEALSDYITARQAIINDVLKAMAVPTHEDLDELYKEIHLLKKRIRNFEKN